MHHFFVILFKREDKNMSFTQIQTYYIIQQRLNKCLNTF